MKIRISIWLALISSFHVLVRYLDGKDCWRQTMNWARNRLFSLLLPAITDKAGSRSEDFSSYISAAFKGLASLAKSALFSAAWNTNFFKTCRDGAQAVSALLFRLSKYLINSYIRTLICIICTSSRFPLIIFCGKVVHLILILVSKMDLIKIFHKLINICLISRSLSSKF